MPELDKALTEGIRQRLHDGKPIRRNISGDGRLRIDRPLPFLSAYRYPCDKGDLGSVELVTTEAAYMFASGDPQHTDELSNVCSMICQHSLERFDAFLLVEVWVDDLSDGEEEDITHPVFRVMVSQSPPDRAVVDAFRSALTTIALGSRKASVEVCERDPICPPELEPLRLQSGDHESCFHLGVAVHPIFRDVKGATLFPLVLQRLRQQFAQALRKLFFSFAEVESADPPPHYHSLGPTSFVQAATLVDQQLCDVSQSFDYILQITPTNSDAAWDAFREDKYRNAPLFEYRPLPHNPADIKRQLFEIPIDRIEDASLAQLFWEKQDELDRQVTSFRDIDTPSFLYGNLQIYGDVEPELLQLAQTTIAKIDPPRGSASDSEQWIDGKELAHLAQLEIGRYRDLDTNFNASVVVCDDIASGIMVCKNQVLVSRSMRVRKQRAEALLHHEIGTHVITYFNGQAQPFQQLYAGLAGYESLQEGLAVLGEYLVGGLTSRRLRTLCARVIAAHLLTAGASFTDTFHFLVDEYKFPKRVAFFITLRIFRAGGSTKDAIYLRGLKEVLEYLTGGLELSRLFVGKIALTHLPIIDEFRRRGTIQPARLLPRYLTDDVVQERLMACKGKTVVDLVGD